MPKKTVKKSNSRGRPKLPSEGEVTDAQVMRVPSVNRSILMIEGRGFKGRCRVRKDNPFRVGDEIKVKWSGERDLYYLHGEYDKRGRIIGGGE